MNNEAIHNNETIGRGATTALSQLQWSQNSTGYYCNVICKRGIRSIRLTAVRLDLSRFASCVFVTFVVLNWTWKTKNKPNKRHWLHMWKGRLSNTKSLRGMFTVLLDIECHWANRLKSWRMTSSESNLGQNYSYLVKSSWKVRGTIPWC